MPRAPTVVRPRNFAAARGTHLCIRGAAGPALFDHDEVGLFSWITNST
jgi:hypothetical protein